MRRPIDSMLARVDHEAERKRQYERDRRRQLNESLRSPVPSADQSSRMAQEAHMQGLVHHAVSEARPSSGPSLPPTSVYTSHPSRGSLRAQVHAEGRAEISSSSGGPFRPIIRRPAEASSWRGGRWSEGESDRRAPPKGFKTFDRVHDQLKEGWNARETEASEAAKAKASQTTSSRLFGRLWKTDGPNEEGAIEEATPPSITQESALPVPTPQPSAPQVTPPQPPQPRPPIIVEVDNDWQPDQHWFKLPITEHHGLVLKGNSIRSTEQGCPLVYSLSKSLRDFGQDPDDTSITLRRVQFETADQRSPDQGHIPMSSQMFKVMDPLQWSQPRVPKEWTHGVMGQALHNGAKLALMSGWKVGFGRFFTVRRYFRVAHCGHHWRPMADVFHIVRASHGDEVGGHAAWLYFDSNWERCATEVHSFTGKNMLNFDKNLSPQGMEGLVAVWVMRTMRDCERWKQPIRLRRRHKTRELPAPVPAPEV